MHAMPAGLSPAGLSIEGYGVIVAIWIGALVALGALVHIGFRLWREEIQVARQIRDEGKPASGEAARNLLFGYERSESAAFLRSALDTGETDTAVLSFNDWIMWPRYLAGIFVFVGLLGTVWGVSVALAHLGSALSQGSALNQSGAVNAFAQSQHLTDSIAQLLTKMQSASLCTLWGLLATVFISLGNNLYSHLSRRHEKSLVALAEEWFLPLWERESAAVTEESILRQLNETAGKMTAAADNLNRQVAQAVQIVHQEASKTSHLTDKLHEIAGKLQAFMDALTAERSGLATASDRVGDEAERMAKAVRELRESLVERQDGEEERHRDFMARVEETQKTLHDILRNFERVLTDVTNISEASPLREAILEVRRDLLDELQKLDGHSSEAQRSLLERMRGSQESFMREMRARDETTRSEIAAAVNRIASLPGPADQDEQVPAFAGMTRPRANDEQAVSPRANDEQAVSPRANDEQAVSPRANDEQAVSPRANAGPAYAPGPVKVSRIVRPRPAPDKVEEDGRLARIGKWFRRVFRRGGSGQRGSRR
jgi:methyl-accepting chemotaxis protein